jgi:Family of unknown function (DUF6580)
MLRYTERRMEQQQKKTGFQPLALTLTVLAALVRLIPHPPNFAPMGSVALFGGAKLRGWQAYIVPILAMLITDPIRSRLEGNYAPYSWSTLVIYSAFLINVVLGRLFLRNSLSVRRIATVAVAGSIQFFLITNFFVWWTAPDMYPHNLTGLTACYVAALPFFGRTVLADLFYSGILFSAYALLRRHRPEHFHRPAAA